VSCVARSGLRDTQRVQKRNSQHPVGSALSLLIAALILSACGARRAPTPYLPPTIAPTYPLIVSGNRAQANLATEAVVDLERSEVNPTPACVPNLTYLEDLTVPDGSPVAPGAILDKRWRVENSGTCNWDENYRLKLIAGPEMGAKPEQALYPARSGTQAMLRIIFTGPEEPGPYRSAWQAYDPGGEPFGDPFFIEVVVQE
jgi:hypothetical protein